MSEKNDTLQIQRSDIFHIGFYKKTWFHGSFQDMHYRIEGITDEAGTKKLRVTTWPGPYNFSHTDDSQKESALFEFSDSGLDAVTDYLNNYHKKHFQVHK
ncbi:MAG: GNAT family acetyltransferase [Clostridiales bacterium]|nr:GNAT family acetyltransferase [Clostridiales bacterium]